MKGQQGRMDTLHEIHSKAIRVNCPDGKMCND
jgi:hypothetical protein